MIINGEKWACETCIKGHRATHCKHTDRQLVMIKKKGRPSTQCKRCRELRVVRQLHVKCDCEDQSGRNVKKNNNTINTLKKKSKSKVLRPLAPKQESFEYSPDISNTSIPASSPVTIHVSRQSIAQDNKHAPSSLLPLASSSEAHSNLPSLSPPSSLISTSLYPIYQHSPNHSQLSSPAPESQVLHQNEIAYSASSNRHLEHNFTKPAASGCCSGKSKQKPLYPETPTNQDTIQSPTQKGCCSSKNRQDKDERSQYNESNDSPSTPTDQKSYYGNKTDESPFLSSNSPASVPFPDIPPPSSCCGPPSKNQQGEIIRVVTCRCGDSCACIGCDAHPSRAMKSSTKDVYVGFDDTSYKNLSIPEICSNEAKPSSDIDHPSSILMLDGIQLCDCGCLKSLEECTCCYNDLCSNPSSYCGNNSI